MVPRVLKLQLVLVPTDFSEPSKKALQYAVAFARQFDAKIALIHVRPMPYYADELHFVPNGLVRDESAEKPLRERLASLAATLPDEVLAKTLLHIGTPFHEISESAKEIDADLIIISTHGRTGFKHVFLGSTAECVVRHAPCPVLVVREREHEFVESTE